MFAPWLIVAVALITLFGLWRVSRITRNWRVWVLMPIPVLFAAAYSWVWLLDPLLGTVSWLVRNIIFYSFGLADFVIYDFILRADVFHRRHDDR